MLRSGILLLLLLTASLHCSDSSKKYMVIMDAGSTGTRVYVYSIDSATITGQTTTITMLGSCKDPDPNCKQITPDKGIASLSPNNQSAMNGYLEPLISFAKSKIPTTGISETQIFLRATAGVRNLSPADKQIHIMSLATNTLASSGFSKFSEARVLSGFQEGAAQWLNVNHALGLLGQVPQKTVGIIEMGGTSEQITFIPEDQPNSFPITLLGQTYPLYSYSYNHLGANEAASVQLPNNPCNSSTASSSYVSCKTAWGDYLNDNIACEPLCGLQGASQPPIPKDMIFRITGGPPTGIAQACGLSSFSSQAIDPIGNSACNNQSPCPSFKGDSNRLCKLLGLLSSELSGSGASFAGFGFSQDTKNILPPDKDGNINGQETTWTKGFVLAKVFGIAF